MALTTTAVLGVVGTLFAVAVLTGTGRGGEATALLAKLGLTDALAGGAGSGALGGLGTGLVGALADEGTGGVGALADEGTGGVGALADEGIEAIGALADEGTEAVGALADERIGAVGPLADEGTVVVGALTGVGSRATLADDVRIGAVGALAGKESGAVDAIAGGTGAVSALTSERSATADVLTDIETAVSSVLNAVGSDGTGAAGTPLNDVGLGDGATGPVASAAVGGINTVVDAGSDSVARGTAAVANTSTAVGDGVAAA